MLAQYARSTEIQQRRKRKAIKETDDTISEMSMMLAPTLLSPFHALYTSMMYHVIKFDVQKNFEDCRTFAFTFSEYPEIFLSTKRTELEFDGVCVTMSINQWVECTSIVRHRLEYTVEYYVHTFNHVPHTIFFRIKNSENAYKIKLDYFIDSILQKEERKLPPIHVEVELMDNDIDMPLLEHVDQVEILDDDAVVVKQRQIIPDRTETITFLTQPKYQLRYQDSSLIVQRIEVIDNNSNKQISKYREVHPDVQKQLLKISSYAMVVVLCYYGGKIVFTV